jgi:hypothetical protein
MNSRSQAHQAGTLQSEWSLSALRTHFLADSGGSKFIRGKHTRTHALQILHSALYIMLLCACVTANMHKSG